jgi:hypothetical protein
MPNERKPHLLKAKQGIVDVVDHAITEKKRMLQLSESMSEKQDDEARREIAIWIKQRNRLARDADLPEVPLVTKSNQGILIYSG